MKKLEKRERENLSRIIYTIIKVSLSAPLILVRGKFEIRIQRFDIPETPLPTYSIVIIRTDETYFEFVISLSISLGYEKYEVRNFKSLGGCKVIKEVIKAMKDETI